jgi:hypothetical protein
MLESLSRGVGDLKRVGQEIGGEVDLHLVCALLYRWCDPCVIVSVSLPCLPFWWLSVANVCSLQKILGDIESNTDKANRNIRVETSRAEHVAKTSGACYYYVAICLLLLVRGVYEVPIVGKHMESTCVRPCCRCPLVLAMTPCDWCHVPL